MYSSPSLPQYPMFPSFPLPFLHLFRTPASVGLPHVRRRLNAGDEFEDDVADTDETDNGAGDNAQDSVVEQDRADKDVKGAATDEGEEEGGVAGDLGWYLELEETDGCFCARIG